MLDCLSFSVLLTLPTKILKTQVNDFVSNKMLDIPFLSGLYLKLSLLLLANFKRTLLLSSEIHIIKGHNFSNIRTVTWFIDTRIND